MRKSVSDAKHRVLKAAIEHAQAIDRNGDSRATQDTLDEACLYFADQCGCLVPDESESGGGRDETSEAGRNRSGTTTPAEPLAGGDSEEPALSSDPQHAPECASRRSTVVAAGGGRIGAYMRPNPCDCDYWKRVTRGAVEPENPCPRCEGNGAIGEPCADCGVQDRSVEAKQSAPGVWRVGNKVPRNLYRGDEPIAMLATAELAAEMAAKLNADGHVEAEALRALVTAYDAATFTVHDDADGAKRRTIEAADDVAEALLAAREKRTP